MEQENDEWTIEADDELIEDYVKNGESFLTGDHWMLAAKALGHSEEESHKMIFGSKARIIQEYPKFHLFRVLRSGHIEDLPTALEGAIMRTIYIDRCPVLHFCMGKIPPLNEKQINEIRLGLSEYYPNDLEYIELSIGSLEGKQLVFRSYDLLNGNKVVEILKVYSEWFEKKAEQLSPKFEAIKDEIKEFLKNKYWIEPHQQGFINWLLTQKLGSFSINFTFTFEKGILLNGSKVPITFNYRYDDRDYIDVELHIQEYCRWKRKQLETIDIELDAVESAGGQTNSLLAPPSTTNNRLPKPDEMRKVVCEILAPLGGYNQQGKKIMSDADFTRLIEYADHLVLGDAIPSDIQLIQQTNISNKHIRFTFYRLHKRLFTTSAIRGNFILLIHSLFRQFENVQDSTTRTKFSEMPPSYFRDFKLPEEVI